MDDKPSSQSEPIQFTRARELTPAPEFSQALRVVLGARQYAVRSREVARVLPMCTWTPLHGPEGPLGLLEVAGTFYPVMDPRPRLGLKTVDIALEHHLLLIRAPFSFVLWVDGVEEVFEVARDQIQRLEVFEGSPVRHLIRHSGETLPLLECAYFSPGEFVRPA